MKSHSYLHIFLSCFFLLPVLSKAQSVNWDLDLSTAQPLHSSLNGFNTGPAFNEIFTASASPQQIIDNCALFGPPLNTVTDYEITSLTPQPDLVEKTASLRPSMLRFPGGTIANYYHLYEYTGGIYDPTNLVFAKGFGAQEKETRVYGGGNPIRRQYCKTDNRINLTDPSENPNYINGFANYVEAVESSVHNQGDSDYEIEVIYVANLLTHFRTNVLSTIKAAHLTPSDPANILNIADPTARFELYYKETIDAIQYLMNRGVKVVGVEMGNELYFNEYQSGHSNVTPQAYMQLCEIYAARIEEVYPDMKFAVASDHANAAWNTTLANYSPSFYDAVVLHEYYTATTCLNANQGCSDACDVDLINDRACRFDCGKCALGDYTESEVTGELAAAIAEFPADKKIWMTEWGIISTGGQGSNLDYFNTFLYASFTFEHLLQQFAYNAESQNRLEYSTHHRIGYKIDWSVIQSVIGTDTSVIRSNFHSFSLLNELFISDSAYQTAGVSSQNLSSATDFHASTFVVPDEEGDAALYLCYTNKGNSDLPFTLQAMNPISFEGNQYTLSTLGKTSYLYAADSAGLYASFGTTKFNGQFYDHTLTPTLFSTESSIPDINSYALPAYSMGVIKLELSLLNTSIEKAGGLTSAIRLYPNPNEGTVYIDLPPLMQQAPSISLFDMKGRNIPTSSLIEGNKAKLETHSLPPGVYFVQLIHPAYRHTEKMSIR